MKLRLLLSSIAAIGLATGTCLAHSPSDRFTALDANDDGVIDQQGFEAAMRDSASAGAGRTAPRPDVFRMIDRNGDGYLSEDELWNVDPPPGSGWLAMDKDGDERISQAEFAAIGWR